MAFSISPGVTTSEVDLTTVVPSVQTSTGAIAGRLSWGPAFKRVTVSNEVEFTNKFGVPTSDNYLTHFTASSFLAYGNNLQVVRAVASGSYNADSGVGATQVLNEDIFESTYLNTNNGGTLGPFIARYPGLLGNSITVSMVDGGTSQYSSWTVNGLGVAGLFPGAPSTSAQCTAQGGLYDELHVVVIDTGGLITGIKNTVLEVFPYLSKGIDAVDSLGNSNYWKNYIFKNSKYIYAVDPGATVQDYLNKIGTWGTRLYGTTFATMSSPVYAALSGGTTVAPTDADITRAYDLFANPDEVDISLLISGDLSATNQQYLMSMATTRKDCIAFISPPYAATSTDAISTWKSSFISTSYAVLDSGWKYMFDKYNNVYRWIPLNGDIAGLCAYTDSVRDPWFSPAGYNRGNLKNVVKLNWNPNKTDRDTLYSMAVNPVVTFPGQGTVLFGDKTYQAKPSAFDRINVRRLFIVLEKSIALAAKYSLFEFNDDFTRAQFVALVTPFLRDVQGRRGIYDFRVVCDTTNNTPQVIDSNQFVGDIYVKPARSINFIQLNFVAVRTGVDFTEVVGKF
jgi:hypothetical protein